MRAYSTEVKLTPEQEAIYLRTIGVCRYVYNLFIEVNDQRLASGLGYMSDMTFSKWFNNEYIQQNPDKIWLKEVSTKSVRNAINNAHNAYLRFFMLKKQPGYVPYSKNRIVKAARLGKELTYYDLQGHPKRKVKGKNDCSYYFVRNSLNQPIKVERHKIKVAGLGWVTLKEYGYIPTAPNVVISGTITRKAERYFISVITREDTIANTEMPYSEGIGIDLGVKEFAVLSNGNVYHTLKQRRLEKRLRREQKRLSKIVRMRLERGEKTKSNGEKKQILVVAKLNQRIANVRDNRLNLIVHEILRTKPKFITLENLNVRGMMKNRHLSRAIADQGFYSFVLKLTTKAKQMGVEVRLVDCFYPSSKLCRKCGAIKKDLKLSDRVFTCECGHVEDRDLNAAINLQQATAYKVA